MPKTVLIVGKNIDPLPPFNEAVKNAVQTLASALARQGVKVHVLGFPRRMNRFAVRRRIDGASYVCVNASRLHPLLRRLLRLHSGWLQPAFVRMFCRYLQPDFVWFHGTHVGLNVASAVHVAGRRFFDAEFALPAGARVSCENASLCEEARRTYPANRVELMYPAVDTGVFAPRAGGPPGSPVRFLFASSPMPEHVRAGEEDGVMRSRGIFDMLAIMEKLEEGLDVGLVLLWRSDTRAISEKLTRVASAELVTEPVPDVSSFMDSFHFGFCLFRDDRNVKGMPQSTMEFLAKGIPVLAYSHTPIGDLVAEHGCGILVDANHPVASVTEVMAACQEDTHYEALSTSARDVAVRMFDANGRAEQFVRCFLSPG